MPPVRIGFVKYLNTLPLVEGLGTSTDLSLVAAAPSRLAPMLRAGEVDLALASIVDLAPSRPRPAQVALELVPAGMIGCDGPTLTVRLFSRVPWPRVRALFADTDSHTSVILARLVLAQRFGVSPTIHDFDARRDNAPPTVARDWPETLLLIGDKVVTDAPPESLYPHQLDLGEAWHEWTGLPFVYAMWMCRAGDMARPEVAGAAALLDRQRRRNAARLGWLINKHAAPRGWPQGLAARYLGGLLRYEPTDAAREGVARFLCESAAAGLLPAFEPAWAALPELIGAP
ncbi:MAG: hypothetical protein HYX51_01090 [Chloroflexi bacterium]|nr:hypothetical protein [Chloroflexota bacterium]